MDNQTLQEVVTEVLRIVPQRPFLCLPMSAMLYTVLKDRSLAEASLVTGDLYYKGNPIFKQDFSIKDAKDGIPETWGGHSWVKADGLIVDISFFRTLYSDKFTKPFKLNLIAEFGQGRGCLIVDEQHLPGYILQYRQVEVLDDDLATGIIKGYKQLL
ncbi:hypothetical protein LL912_12385 [Niabella sp. CC-SYL272]|uniref:hypothetical protein n=1 Tax=Niabella agricola TaxID=2891571 RepID=UPI001F3344DB|nr:hypothetical protein [Niabella agricola]MCF3109570.1 hypothetical protein [Niabella agricola]